MTTSPAPSSVATEAAQFIEPTLDQMPPDPLPPADEYMPAPEPEPAGNRDPVAPYGYLKDGVTPRKSPAGRPPKTTAKPAKKTAPRSRTAQARPRPSLAPPPAPVAPTAPPGGPAVSADRSEVIRYAQGVSQVIGYGQKIVIGSALGVKARGNDKAATTLLADAAALGAVNAPLAMVAGQLAAENPDHVAVKALNKLIVAGPYAEAGFAVLVFVGQVAVNHGAIPAGWLPGTKKPQVLADALIAEMEAMAEQA